ncbi:hypothetical protein LTS10_011871 [Elasticomyces elasticus]|nr:hypothetical protein LTS10_011871 [Elasticomyces elasticus]
MQFNITTIMAVATVLTGAAAARSSPGDNSISCYGACETDLKAVFETSAADAHESTYLDAVSCISKCEEGTISQHSRIFDFAQKRLADLEATSMGEAPDRYARSYRMLEIVREGYPYVIGSSQNTHYYHRKAPTGCYRACEPALEAYMFIDKHGDHHQELLYDTAKFCITHCEGKGSQWIEEGIADSKKCIAEMEEADLEQQIAEMDEADLDKQIHEAKIKMHGPRYWGDNIAGRFDM